MSVDSFACSGLIWFDLALEHFAQMKFYRKDHSVKSIQVEPCVENEWETQSLPFFKEPGHRHLVIQEGYCAAGPVDRASMGSGECMSL